jgi:hypothetical protein
LTCAVAPVTPLTLPSAAKASLFGIISWRCWAQSEHGIARPRTVAPSFWVDFSNLEPNQKYSGQLGVCYPPGCRPRHNGKRGRSLTRTGLFGFLATPSHRVRPGSPEGFPRPDRLPRGEAIGGRSVGASRSVLPWNGREAKTLGTRPRQYVRAKPEPTAPLPASFRASVN